MEIREEAPGDRARVFEVEEAAFGGRDEAVLVERLREEAHPTLSLVAVHGDRIMGHVFFSPTVLEVQPEELRTAALGPIGVDPEVQGRGIGSALVRAGLERAAELGWSAVFLVGNPAYYARFGFVLGGTLGFSYPNPALAPALQVAVLGDGALEGARGIVYFHPAFAEAEDPPPPARKATKASK